ncbi:uncharacterized protein LOC134716616 [Mytilus trossulus]|uniref:uncharacterized protein LOC134716616 n=1 Tax=Mytilus trossulus TaxID=6551 RepID=UPI003006DCC2
MVWEENIFLSINYNHNPASQIGIPSCCLSTTTITQPLRLEVVVDLLNEWKTERPEDNFHLRLKGDHQEQDYDNLEMNQSDEQETEDDVRIGEAYTRKLYGTNSKFLYVHQTKWQRRLLELYGKEICLLDATYRTTRYSIPLYFLCVPTNVNYITVGTFITETEDSASLMEALQVIKDWNPEWVPKYFMCDYATEEINALENVFPGSYVYLCDFHREQSWERWLTAANNGLNTEKNNVLSLLRPVARALNEEDYNSALSTLKVLKMSQNLNEGYNYFMDVVFVEAQIILVSYLRGISISEADKLLYPIKKHNEQV